MDLERCAACAYACVAHSVGRAPRNGTKREPHVVLALSLQPEFAARRVCSARTPSLLSTHTEFAQHKCAHVGRLFGGACLAVSPRLGECGRRGVHAAGGVHTVGGVQTAE
eukprot:357322-Chlamydomonas_euryale.AAC.3